MGDLITKFYRNIWLRRIPFGLFSWRFLLPNQSEAIRVHRKLAMNFYPQIPRSIWLLSVIFVGLRWMIFYAPYYSYKITRNRAKAIEDQTGLNHWQQYRQVLIFSIGHGLAPTDWYNYRLYQSENRQRWSQYAYDQEGSAFHNYRNRGRSDCHKHQTLLGDKWAFEQWCHERGLPISQTLKHCPQGDKQFSQHLLQLTQTHGKLFIKRRQGNQAKGAFMATLEQNQLAIHPFDKTEADPAKTGQETYLNDRIVEADCLIQRLYQNPVSLQHPKALEYAVTIRAISRYDKGSVCLDCAYLEWPLVDEVTQQVNCWLTIPIAPENGQIQTNHCWLREHPLEKIQTSLLDIDSLPTTVPDWHTLVKTVQAAHPELSGIYSIAWDFIPAEQGMVLLEGNSGWRLSIPQWFTQPLLAD